MSFSLHTINKPEVVESSINDLYSYRAFIGHHTIITDRRNSYWVLDKDKVSCYSGKGSVLDSNILCVEIFGYTPEDRTSTYNKLTDLPYINGCSTKQLLNPVRPGDPTWQLLYMPPYTTEQQHHIHSTTRIVYIHQGSGISHLGSVGETTIDLKPGNVLILDKMIPHHFSTTEDNLVVLPLHIFSSTDNEFDHPMFRGTYRI